MQLEQLAQKESRVQTAQQVQQGHPVQPVRRAFLGFNCTHTHPPALLVRP